MLNLACRWDFQHAVFLLDDHVFCNNSAEVRKKGKKVGYVDDYSPSISQNSRMSEPLKMMSKC
jgi:hypothetical protein